jgi:hypothetical protein
MLGTRDGRMIWSGAFDGRDAEDVLQELLPQL